MDTILGMSTNIFNKLEQSAKKYNVPRYVWYPIVMLESGGNPYARNYTKNEDSRGLFQVNVNAHPDANPDKLFNADYNINYWMPRIGAVTSEGIEKGLTGIELTKYVQRYGQRSAWNNNVINGLTKRYNELVSNKLTDNDISQIEVDNENKRIIGYKRTIKKDNDNKQKYDKKINVPIFNKIFNTDENITNEDEIELSPLLNITYIIILIILFVIGIVSLFSAFKMGDKIIQVGGKVVKSVVDAKTGDAISATENAMDIAEEIDKSNEGDI